MSKDEVLNRFMAQRGLKSTRQRSLIIDTFFQTPGHLSVEDLWSKVRAQDQKVSVATVYRTMKLLSECGLAHARNRLRHAGLRFRQSQSGVLIVNLRNHASLLNELPDIRRYIDDFARRFRRDVGSLVGD